MTEERKHAILLATVILTARKLQPLLEADDEAGSQTWGRNFGRKFTQENLWSAQLIFWI
jgi:hypothetical protein